MTLSPEEKEKLKAELLADGYIPGKKSYIMFKRTGEFYHYANTDTGERWKKHESKVPVNSGGETTLSDKAARELAVKLLDKVEIPPEVEDILEVYKQILAAVHRDFAELNINDAHKVACALFKEYSAFNLFKGRRV